MNPISDLNQLRTVLVEMGLDAEKVDQMVTILSPIYDFNTFLKAKLQLDDNSVQVLSNNFIQQELQTTMDLTQVDDPLAVFELCGAALGRMGAKYDYPRYAELPGALMTYIKLLPSNQLS